MLNIIQLIPIISAVIFSGLFFYFRSLVFQGYQAETLIYYLTLIWQPLRDSVFWLMAVTLLSFAVYLAWTFLKFSIKFADLQILFIKRLKELPLFFKKEFSCFIKYAFPTVLSLFFISFILGYVNQINSVNLKDELLVKIDTWLTGVYPYFYFASFSYPEWFSGAVTFSFKNLVPFVIVTAAYAFFKNKQVFKKMSISFCLSLLFMISLWSAFPALSPHDRFIDNVYNLQITDVMAKKIADYKPSVYVGKFLLEMRAGKERSKAPYVPTSTMPSAHVAWAVMTGFYLFKTKSIIGIMSLPFLFLSSFGTVFLAQHYFIDVLGGIAVSLLAILLAMV